MSELESAEAAYQRGDFAETRRLARSILGGPAPVTDKIRADELLGKLRPDRAALGLLLACLIFFVLVLSRYAGH
jgi:hypothetical protein